MRSGSAYACAFGRANLLAGAEPPLAKLVSRFILQTVLHMVVIPSAALPREESVILTLSPLFSLADAQGRW